jgi:uncharacterized RDD family membrane protein YckC
MVANGIDPYYPGYGFGNEFGYGYGYGYGYGNGIGNYHLSGASAAIMMAVFVILLAYIVAELVLFAKGKTIGKAILGLQVVSSNDGKPFRFWKMFFRECFVKSASGSVLFLGYIWVLIDEKNRGWHDKILDSYVVDIKESEKMNLRRHLEKVRAEVQETMIPEVQAPDGHVIEETPEPIEIETEASAEDTEELLQERPQPDMSMKKEELLEAARERGVKVSSRATKAAIIEAIEKATAEEEKEETE